MVTVTIFLETVTVTILKPLLVRQRVRPDLQVVDLRAVRRAALVVEHGARPRHRPQAFALPAGLGIVDAAVSELAEEAGRIGDTQVDDLRSEERRVGKECRS